MAKVVNIRPELASDADARLAAIVDSSFDAIVGKDINGIITSWNRAAEKLFGYTADEIIGRSILTLIPDSLQGEETEIIERVRKGERVPSFETMRRRKDGSLVAVSLTVSPIRNSQGEITGASKIARDITEAKENQRRIRLLMREVNHRVKNQFAVILSIIRETGKRATDPRDFEERVRDRIMALSRSHDLLVTSDWSGASLFELIQELLKPFGHEERITLSGPLITLQPNAVQHLGMAFHELGTNSSKYGALASDVGKVTVTWELTTNASGQREIELVWDESSALPEDNDENEVLRQGFGSVVLKRVAPQALNGSAMLERTPGHVRWSLTAPQEAILAQQIIVEEPASAGDPSFGL